MRRCSQTLLTLVASAVLATPVQAQGKDRSLPRIVGKDGRHALLVDGAPFLVLGAQSNNSSAWPAVLPEVWPAMEQLCVNTVELPINLLGAV